MKEKTIEMIKKKTEKNWGHITNKWINQNNNNNNIM